MAALLLVSRNAHALTRIRDSGTQLGVDPRRFARARRAALAVGPIVGIVLATLVGELVGIGLFWATTLVSHRVVGWEPTSLWVPILASTTLHIATTAITTRTPRQASANMPARRATLAAGLLSVAVVVTWFHVDKPPAATAWSAALVGLLAIAAGPLPSLLLRRDGRATLRARLVTLEARRHTRQLWSVTVMMGLVIGLSCGFFTLLSSMVATARAELEPEALPGQVVITKSGSREAPADGLTSLVEDLTKRPTIAVHQAGNTTVDYRLDLDDSSFGGVLLLVDDPDAAAAVLGRELTSNELDGLRAGGVLGPATKSTRSLTPLVRGRAAGRVMELPATRASIPRARWLSGVTGLALTETARRATIEFGKPLRVATQVSDDEAPRLRSAALIAGHHPASVAIHTPMPSPIPPLVLTLTRAALAVITAAVAWLAAQELTASVVPLGRTLHELGVAPSSLTKVVAVQVLSCLTVGCLVGLAAGVGSATLASRALQGFETSIDWWGSASLVGTVLLTTALAFLVALRRLSREIRTTDPR